jgi:hypothetical protein
MIDMLRNPPAQFSEVIKLHFKIKAPEILETVQGWLEEAPNFNPSGQS